MNTGDLIERIAARTGLPKAQVQRMMRALSDEIAATLVEGDSVRVSGLGTFSRGWRGQSTVRSLKDRRKTMIGARHIARFKASSKLRDALTELTDQTWRDPEHQHAWRTAEVLVSDLDLYASKRPSIAADAALSDVDGACAAVFGEEWRRAVATYRGKVPPGVDTDNHYLLESARRRWKK